ncbi:MAG: GNAT family N-acetyltransferase [Cloacibacterium sp.]|nr:GNAT family N-acetyltransferase [Cloacibacterium sp.]
MEILKATEDQTGIIRDLATQSWNVHYHNIISQQQIDYMLEMMYADSVLKAHWKQPHYHYYLFRDYCEYLGFMGFEFDYEAYTTKLHRIYFLPHAMGKGFGREAVDFLTEEVKKIGNRRIILTVNKNNSSKKFYEKCGFKVYDEGIFDIGNGYVMDDYLMELILK